MIQGHAVRSNPHLSGHMTCSLLFLEPNQQAKARVVWLDPNVYFPSTSKVIDHTVAVLPRYAFCRNGDLAAEVFDRFQVLAASSEHGVLHCIPLLQHRHEPGNLGPRTCREDVVHMSDDV